MATCFEIQKDYKEIIHDYLAHGQWIWPMCIFKTVVRCEVGEIVGLY